MGRADQDIVEPVAIDVAERCYGIAAHVAQYASRFAAVDAYPGVGRTTGVAKDDISGALVVRAVGWRGHHEIADAIAIEVARIGDVIALLRVVLNAIDIYDADGHAQSRGGIEVCSRDSRSDRNIVTSATENHVSAVVDHPEPGSIRGNARSAHDDVRKAIAVDIADADRRARLLRG